MAMDAGTGRTVVIGIGNPYRRDDGLGPAVVSLLRDRLAGRSGQAEPATPRAALPGVELAECDGEPSRLIELWSGAELVVLVDAVRTHRPCPGKLHRLSVYHPAVATATAAASSHGVSLGEAIDLARVLGRMPPRLLLFAVEAGDVDFGVGLSPEVARAAVEVAAEIGTLVSREPRYTPVARP